MKLIKCFICMYGLFICSYITPVLTSSLGELSKAEQSAHIQLDFSYTVNEDYIDITETEVTGVSSSSNFVSLKTISANVSSSSIIESKARLRHHPGQGHVCTFGAAYQVGVATNKQLVGIGNDLEGFFLGYNGSAFGVISRTGGVDTFVSQSNWNQDILDGSMGTAFTLDQTKVNRYKIQYKGDYGATKFYVADPTTGKWVLVHIIQYPNSSSSAILQNSSLQLRASVENDGATTPSSDVELKVLSMAAHIEGKINKAFAVRNSVGTGLVNFNNTLTTLLSIQNSNNYEVELGVTRVNHVLVQLDELSFISRGTDNSTEQIELSLYVKKSQSDFSTPINNPNQYTSVVLQDSSYTVTDDKKVAKFYAQSRGRRNQNKPDQQRGNRKGNLYINLTDHMIVLYPGDVLTITAQLTNAGSVNGAVSLSWREFF